MKILIRSGTKIIIILIVLTLSIPSSGQKGYQDGYVITNENDTLTGKIKDRKLPPFGKIYKKIRFRNKSIFTRKFSPEQIRSYCQGELEFESLWINVSYSLFTANYSSIPGYGEMQFLKVISKGYLTYYEWESVDYESGYFDAIPLFKREKEPYFERVTQGILGLKKKRLSEYFQDCLELVNKIENGEIKNPVEIAVFYNLWKENN